MRFALTMVLAVAVLTASGTDARGQDVLDSPVAVSWVNAKLTDALADLASQAGVGFILDPSMPETSRSALVTYASSQTSLKVALGRALQAAGLRYALINGAIWISTPKRVAERLVYKGNEDLTGAGPMSRGEALDTLSPVDDVPDITRPQKPWRKRPSPSVNPVTGITDFPAPPVWIDSHDADNPRFRYTNRPSFLKPEYRKDGDAGDSDDANAAGYLLNLIRSHPEWTREDIVLMLQKRISEAQ